MGRIVILRLLIPSLSRFFPEFILRDFFIPQAAGFRNEELQEVVEMTDGVLMLDKLLLEIDELRIGQHRRHILTDGVLIPGRLSIENLSATQFFLQAIDLLMVLFGYMQILITGTDDIGKRAEDLMAVDALRERLLIRMIGNQIV